MSGVSSTFIGPMQVLAELSERRASGELICVGDNAEVHVYFQRGKVAWATDSVHPFAFTRRLQEISEIDDECFRDILESCKRERRPLGETLVSWGAASIEEVREALRYQVTLAIEVIRACGESTQSLFLDRTRQFSEYDSTLTFELDDLIREPSIVPPVLSPTPAPRPSSIQPPISRDFARQILDRIDGAIWAGVFEGVNAIELAPEPVDQLSTSEELIQTTTLDGSMLVVVRDPSGSLGAASLGRQRSIWCRLSRGAVLGPLFSELSLLVSARHDDPSPSSSSARVSAWSVGESGVGAATASALIAEIRRFIEEAPETLAAVVLDVNRPSASVAAGAGITPEIVLELAHRRMPLLSNGAIFRAEWAGTPNAAVQTEPRTVFTAESCAWMFGVRLPSSTSQYLWLLLSRHASQGLGWAYLTTLSRQLAYYRGGGRRA